MVVSSPLAATVKNRIHFTDDAGGGNFGVSKPQTPVGKLKLADVRAVLLFVLLLPLGSLIRRRRPDIWLVSERPGEARDNAYWFFRYVHENSLHPATYYVIRKDVVDADRLRNVAEHRLIAYGSLRHYLYYIASAVHISAHVGGGMPNARVVRRMERWRLLRNRKVFLQHGVTKDTLDWAFRRHSHIDLFCCTAERERQHVLNTFGYDEDQVALTGLCRYDQLPTNSPYLQDKYILVMPTWRTYLARVGEDELRESDYFKTYTSLLSNPELHEILKTNRCRLIFHLHPDMQRFIHMFSPVPSLVQLSGARDDIQVLLKNASLLITDYSSVFFDFAYMSRPVVYYQFDYAAFRARHWATGYFDYDADGFGPIALTEAELIDAVRRVVQGGFVSAAVYRARSKEFFAFHDAENCARTHAAIASKTARTKP